MHNEILPGISIDAAGQVNVDKRIGELLFDLALQLEDLQVENAVGAPVDIEHVLAAIVLAAREGEINADTDFTKDNSDLLRIVRRHLMTVFDRYGGQLGRDN